MLTSYRDCRAAYQNEGIDITELLQRDQETRSWVHPSKPTVSLLIFCEEDEKIRMKFVIHVLIN